jgi:hypothetical protein
MPTTIACKQIASLNEPEACERSFWLRHRCSRMPFSIFPGIFSSIDGFSKSLTDAAHVEGALPGWLVERYGFTEPIKVPHFSRFHRHDPETGITLRGAPDAMFRRCDGSIAIVDWKCAKYTAGQRELSGLYDAQLSAYAWIAESYGFTPITHLSLIYTQPVTTVASGDVDRLITDDGFVMPFSATIVPVENQAGELIPRLLRRARRILDAPLPPAVPNCKDCAALENLISLINGASLCLK